MLAACDKQQIVQPIRSSVAFSLEGLLQLVN